jgi:hypothetical protein
MPVFPFFIIMPAMLIEPVWARSKKIAVAAMILLCGCFAFNAARESNIENLFRNKQSQYVFTEDKDTPVYIINGAWSLWKYANLIPYVHDEQSYYVIDWLKYFNGYFKSQEKVEAIILPEADNYNNIYLLTEYFPDWQQINNLIMENLQTAQGPLVQDVIESEFEIYTGEPESWFPYFKGKKIKLKEQRAGSKEQS